MPDTNLEWNVASSLHQLSASGSSRYSKTRLALAGLMGGLLLVFFDGDVLPRDGADAGEFVRLNSEPTHFSNATAPLNGEFGRGLSTASKRASHTSVRLSRHTGTGHFDVGHGAPWMGLFLSFGLGVVCYSGRNTYSSWWQRLLYGLAAAGTVEDTATRRPYDEELYRTNRRLRESLDEKKDLLAATVHDLKTPFLGIQRLSEIVLESEELTDSGQRKLELIRSSAIDGLDHVDALLDRSTTQSEEATDVEPVDLAALAEWVVRAFQPHAEHKAQGLRLDASGESCVIEGSELKLREAMGNIVSNALKYTPPGGMIDVSVVRDGETVRFSVADDGPGLSEDDQDGLFAPFQKLGPEPTGEESSSGLGLYLTKRIVDSHDGKIEVESTEGEGSTFALVFPAEPPDATAPSVGVRDGEEVPSAVPGMAPAGMSGS